MRLRHIEVFHAIMQVGTISGAAKLLYVTQPAVTRFPSMQCRLATQHTREIVNALLLGECDFALSLQDPVQCIREAAVECLVHSGLQRRTAARTEPIADAL